MKILIWFIHSKSVKFVFENQSFLILVIVEKKLGE